MRLASRHPARTALATALLLVLAGCQSPPDTPRTAAPKPSPAENGAAAAEIPSEVVNVEAPPLPSPPPPPAPPAPPVHEARQQLADASFASAERHERRSVMPFAPAPPTLPPQPPAVNTETYAHVPANPVQRAAEQPVSTFSIDVDTGSYSNVRRMLQWGQRPPADAVRIEEILNYFDYGDAAPPSRTQPFAVHTEFASAPWNTKRLLLRVALKAYEVPAAELPPSNLVFLVDTSGSMQDADKLPLVKQALRELVQQMRPQDRIALAVYAGSAGLVLPSTPGTAKGLILEALDRLEAGGSTNGGAGIELAYRVAREAKIDGGVNRVVLATDGDFNTGTIDPGALATYVAEQRRSGIALSTLGFGQGNYNDAMAERLADVGDGNHAYIDSPREARKVLRDEMAGTLLTVAKDVKIQVEFNPAEVAEYRLVGYENRQLRREDFANDAVDAGEIGAGHDVTALYEIALVGGGGEWTAPLKYAAGPSLQDDPGTAGEIATVRLRYKQPEGDRSRLIEKTLQRRDAVGPPSPSLRWASAVAAYGERLRGGEALGGADWPEVIAWLDAAYRATPDAPDAGSRAELLQLARQAAALSSTGTPGT